MSTLTLNNNQLHKDGKSLIYGESVPDPTPPTPSTNLKQEAIGVWEMNAPTGEYIPDELGVHDASVIRMTRSSGGKIGTYCYESTWLGDDTIHQRIEIPDASIRGWSFNIGTGDSWAVNFWVKSSDPSPTTAAPYLISDWNGGYDPDSPYRFLCVIVPSTGDNEIRSNIYNGYTTNQIKITPGTPVWDGDWHMITKVINCAAGTHKIYLDGTLVSTGNFSYSSQSAEVDHPMMLGQTWVRGSNKYFRTYVGFWDQVSIWGRELLQDDIDDLWNNGDGLPFSQW